MSSASKKVIEALLEQAGIGLGGRKPWDIQVHDDRLYDRILREQNLGLGEAYVEGWWDCPRLDAFFHKVLSAGLDRELKRHLKLLFLALSSALLNFQTRRGCREVAHRHYNLGNDLFTAFLDPYLQYSCALFKETRELDVAQLRKLDLICRKLDLGEEDRVLDIGCGWGGLARYMAEKYGCHVTGVNIAREQIHFSREFCAGLPIEIVETDYRDVRGTFDKIVSVGMFEHVGSKNYRTFTRLVHSRLAEDGVFLLHTIGCNVSRTGCDPWITKYIFPNGMLPSIAQISRAAEGLLVIEDIHNIGPHYDPTLMAWNERFHNNWDAIRGRYGETFRRMWSYYLQSCAGAFRARDIQVWQIVMTKTGRNQPPCR
ncbi:MAG: cyclopropane fatty acyl phospholipid synthase [Deltaproteobacteria bacterium]|nr:cyclopropane fatty acyl phospholipid synthase [Deltaproteobacteria bacterium]